MIPLGIKQQLIFVIYQKKIEYSLREILGVLGSYIRKFLKHSIQQRPQKYAQFVGITFYLLLCTIRQGKRGNQIYGMDKLLTERSGILCTLADDPASCVAYGCGKSLAWINHMSEGPINIAKKRIMRQ